MTRHQPCPTAPTTAGGAAVSGEDARSVVRLYAVTGGRTRPHHRLALHTVLSIGSRRPRPDIPQESAQIIDLCRHRQRPVAELAGVTGLHITAVKILVSDLIRTGALDVPAVPDGQALPDDLQLLSSVLVGLRRKFPHAQTKAG